MKSAVRGIFSGVVLMFVACSSTYEPKDVVPARPGLVVPDASGEATSESAACSALTDALAAARTRLHCVSDAGPPSCPAYIRPLGSQRCRQYDKGTVESCVAVIGGYKSCAELDSKPCVVVALEARDPACESETADAAPDATGEEAGPETGTQSDAGSDSSSDATSADAAKDAPLG